MTDTTANNSPKKQGSRPMRWVKRLFLLITILLVLLVGALFAIPFFFKDQLLAAVKDSANESLNAQLEFSDASLSFFRDFPKLTLSLDEFSVTNNAPFEGIKLVEGDRFSFSFDLMSVIKADRALQIHSVDLEGPKVQVLVLSDGTANYDITLPADSTATEEEAASTSSGLEIMLDDYRITNGDIIYDDQSQDMYLNLVGLNHSGNGRFTMDVYDLDTETDLNALTFKYDGVQYFDETAVDMDAGFLINLTDQQYTLKENRIQLNDLVVEAAGYVSLPDDSTMDMNLSFAAPGNNFRELFSLIPNAFVEGYEDVSINGNFSLDGKVNGQLAGDNYPAIEFNLVIDNGQFRYPDLPLGISDIQTEMHLNKPQGILDRMVVDIPDFQMRVGEELLTGHFKLAQPISDPKLDAGVRGKLDLRDLQDAYPIDGVSKLSGILVADVTAKARMSQLVSEAYEDVDISGSLDLESLEYVADGSPAISISQAGLDFNPEQIDIRQFEAKMGNSDISASGGVRNFLAYFSPNEVMKGEVVMRSGLLDLNEWASTGSTEEVVVNTPSTEVPASEAPFDRFDFTVDIEVERMLYDTYDLRSSAIKGRMSANRTNLDVFTTTMEQSDIAADGYITNTWDYLFEGGTLGGVINLRSNYLDLNPFMVITETSEDAATPGEETEAYGAILVPDNLDITINADIRELQYTDMNLTDLQGRLRVANEAVAIEDCETKILGGDIAMAGTYDSKDQDNPYFNFKYDLQNIDFQKAFQTFNTFQTLAPVGEYITGNFSSTLIMEGILKPDMSVDYTQLTANGFLETFEAYVQGFPPLQALGNQLNVDYFNHIDIQDTRNWFEFQNGVVEVKEFDLSHQGIDMKIGGTHSIAQEVNYNIMAKVPREMLSNNAVGAVADSGLDFLRSQASQLGVSLEESEFVNLQVGLTGSMSSPKVNVKLLGTEGNQSLADAAKEEAADMLEAEARERLEAERDRLEEQAEDIRDSIASQVTEQVEDIRDDAQEQLQEAAQEQLDNVQENVGELLEEQGQKSADDIREELENFNPFKKKKKGGG